MSVSSRLMRVALGIVLAGLAIAGLVVVRCWPQATGAAVELALNTARGLGMTGWALAALAQILISLCGVLPASVGGLAAGVLYGVLPGFLLSGLGTLVGAVLAFLLARSVFRPAVGRALSRRPRLERLDEAVSRDGWRIVCLLRISPVMPFAMTSYALGLTSLALRDYLIGTLAALPALFGYVVLGHLAGAGVNTMATPGAGPLRWTLLVMAIGATGLLTLRCGWLVARVFRMPRPPIMDDTRPDFGRAALGGEG